MRKDAIRIFVAAVLTAGFPGLAARPAEAFKGPEHQQISNLALWLAFEEKCRSAASPEPACAAARELLASSCAKPDCEETKDKLDFGDYTRAVDSFAHSSHIAPDLDTCREPDPAGCPEGSECESSSDACFDAAAQSYAERIVKRQRARGALMRLLAIHLNTEHFRRFAADRYGELHERAVQLAAAGHFELALRTEGVALHFLQDLFAPGHLASARADLSDTAAGSLHDRFNKEGLPFWVVPDPAWCELLENLDVALGESLRAAPGASLLPPPAKKRLTVDVGELENVKAVLGCRPSQENGSPLRYQAFGDSRLYDARDDPEKNGSRHRLFLILASAWSVRQVLSAEGDSDLLLFCFQDQSAKIEGSSSEKRRTPDWETSLAPGAVLTRKGSLPLDRDFDTCQPGLEGALAGYVTGQQADEKTRAELDKLHRMVTRISVLEAAWSPILWGESNGGTPISRWELGWTFNGSVPYSELAQRDGDGRLIKDQEGNARLYSGLKRDTPLTATWAIHQERHEEFEAWGVGMQVNYHDNFGKSNLNSYVIVEPGYALYRNDAREAWRWRASVRYGVGYSLIFFEVGAERGFALDSTGDGHREWRYFAGPRIRFSTSWLP